ncbi:lysophospholipid acyltransferase family protein [bacterium]|nr:lysophospholipid acyltransferase family protein [bacterium]
MTKSKTRVKQLIDKIVVLPMAVFYMLIRKLPESLCRIIFRLLGRMVNTLRIRRSVVDDNLRIAFSDLSDSERESLRNQVYVNFGNFLGEWIASSGKNKSVSKKVRFDGLEIVTKAIEQGKGVLCCSAHFCQWELLASSLCSLNLIPISVIRRQLKNSSIDKWYSEMHEQINIHDIIKGRSMLEIFKRLKKHEMIGMLVDQSGRGSGVWVPFFNRPTSFHRGPGVIMSKRRCPAITVFCLPDRDGGWVMRARELKVNLTGNVENDTFKVMSEYASQLESAIKEFPDGYFWFHRRWKIKPPADVMAKWESGGLE